MTVTRFDCLFASVFVFAISGSAHAALEGFFPAQGGNITVQPTGGPVQASGIEFLATAGSLTQGESAAPFAFFIPDSTTPGHVTLASLGSPVTLDGPTTLNVVASADAIISATFGGDGVLPVAFPVTGGGGGSSLAASFAYDGGPITIEPRFGNPYNARSLSFDATSGTLTGGGSPAPFESIVGNTPQNWSVNSTTDVLIDGPVVLDVSASRGAIVDATSNDGTNSNQFRVTRIDPVPTDRLTGSFASGGGPITIESTSGPVVTRGLDLTIPEPAFGATFSFNSDPSPYSTVDVDPRSTDQWRVSSDADVVIDGRVTLSVNVFGRSPEVKGIVTDETTSNLFPVEERERIRLTGHYPYGGGPVSIIAQERNPAQLRGISLSARQGTLTGGGSAAPFASVDANSATEWSVSSTADVSIDGLVELDLTATADAEILGTFDDGYQSNDFSVNRSFPSSTNRLRGTYPAGGGAVTLESVDGPFVSRGLDITDLNGGELTTSGSAAPFETVTKSAGPDWSVRSTTDVTIDGTVTLDLNVPQNPNLFAATTDGSNWNSFSIRQASPNVGNLEGTFPLDGGPITIFPTEGPIATLGIQITAVQGTIAQGDSPRPFQFFLPNFVGEQNQVNWGNLGTTVVIDGPIELDATASADAVLEGLWGDGATPALLTITQGGTIDPGTGGGDGSELMDNSALNQESIDLAIEDLDPTVLESQLLLLFPEGGGPLTLLATNGPVETLGVEFVAEEGSIFAGDSAAPFSFFLGDEENRIVLGSLGVPVVIDEPITLDIFATADATLVGAWGDGAFGTFPGFAVPNVPEPSSSSLAFLAMLSLLAFRRRVRPCFEKNDRPKSTFVFEYRFFLSEAMPNSKASFQPKVGRSLSSFEVRNAEKSIDVAARVRCFGSRGTCYRRNTTITLHTSNLSNFY